MPFAVEFGLTGLKILLTSALLGHSIEIMYACSHKA